MIWHTLSEYAETLGVFFAVLLLACPLVRVLATEFWSNYTVFTHFKPDLRLLELSLLLEKKSKPLKVFMQQDKQLVINVLH